MITQKAMALALITAWIVMAIFIAVGVTTLSTLSSVIVCLTVAALLAIITLWP